MTADVAQQDRDVDRPIGVVGQLQPVRRALLEDAERDAARLVDQATASAEQRVASAEEAAEEAVEQARRRARETAAARTDQVVDEARREAHRSTLGVEAEMWSVLVDRLQDAVGAMRLDPRYPQLLDGLEQLARDQLGGDASIERDPEGGGVLATLGARHVDYRMAALAERVLDAAADEVTGLWE